MIGDSGEDIREPGVRIDVVEPAGLNEGIDRSRPASSLVGSVRVRL